MRMYEVRPRHVEEQPTLVMMAKLPVSGIAEFLGRAYSAVAEQMSKEGLDFAGPPFGRYRPLDEEFTEFEIEAGFPVDRPGEGGGEVVGSMLPGGAVAVVTHIGPYDQMRPGYEAILRWIEEHDGHPEGPAWEVYYSDPAEQPDPSTWKTEIVQPYRVL
jgi:effector-binding domain-containing protein